MTIWLRNVWYETSARKCKKWNERQNIKSFNVRSWIFAQNICGTITRPWKYRLTDESTYYCGFTIYNNVHTYNEPIKAVRIEQEKPSHQLGFPGNWNGHILTVFKRVLGLYNVCLRKQLDQDEALHCVALCVLCVCPAHRPCINRKLLPSRC